MQPRDLARKVVAHETHRRELREHLAIVTQILVNGTGTSRRGAQLLLSSLPSADKEKRI